MTSKIVLFINNMLNRVPTLTEVISYGVMSIIAVQLFILCVIKGSFFGMILTSMGMLAMLTLFWMACVGRDSYERRIRHFNRDDDRKLELPSKQEESQNEQYSETSDR